MDLQIKDKVAMVTGGGGGIGRAVVLCLAQEGAKVAAVDLNLEVAQLVIEEVRSAGGEGLALSSDVTKSEDVDFLFQKVTDVMGRIDILVNNVGGGSGIALAAKSSVEDWDNTIEVNLKSAYLCCRAAAKVMFTHRQGRIINMSSVSGRQGEQLLSAYCAAKFGVIGLTQTLAKELARYNITVNAVCPGYVFTPGWEKLAEAVREIQPAYEQMSFREMFDARVREVTPLGRPQSPEEIAALVAYLASEDARSITGQSISIDGGIVMR